MELAAAALDRLIAAGPAPDRVTQAIGGIVAAWADEPDITPELVNSRVEQLWDGFSSQAAALQEALSDGTESPPGRRVLAALDAATATLAAIAGR